MDLWPVGIGSGSGSLDRALAGLVLLAVGYELRNAAVLVYLARSSQILRFPPKREFRPRLGRRRRDPGRRRRELTTRKKVALWSGVAVGSVLLVAAMGVAFLAALVAAFVAVGAVGWFLGPVAAAAIWVSALTASVAAPVALSPDRAAAWGRLYRSARDSLAHPALLGGSVVVLVPSPLLPLVRWADRQVMRRVDVTAGPAPWVEPRPGRRRRRAGGALPG